MVARIIKNGVESYDLIPTAGHVLPETREECWHDCILIVDKRLIAGPRDVLTLELACGTRTPFILTRCQVGVKGWLLEGKMLF